MRSSPKASTDVLTGWMDAIAALGLEDMSESVREAFDQGRHAVRVPQAVERAVVKVHAHRRHEAAAGLRHRQLDAHRRLHAAAAQPLRVLDRVDDDLGEHAHVWRRQQRRAKDAVEQEKHAQDDRPQRRRAVVALLPTEVVYVYVLK